MKVVDVRHVSEEDASLCVQDRRQESSQMWVFHLRLVALQRRHSQSARRPHRVCWGGGGGLFSQEGPTAALPRRSSPSQWAPSSRDCDAHTHKGTLLNLWQVCLSGLWWTSFIGTKTLAGTKKSRFRSVFPANPIAKAKPWCSPNITIFCPLK